MVDTGYAIYWLWQVALSSLKQNNSFSSWTWVFYKLHCIIEKDDDKRVDCDETRNKKDRNLWKRHRNKLYLQIT